MLWIWSHYSANAMTRARLRLTLVGVWNFGTELQKLSNSWIFFDSTVGGFQGGCRSSALLLQMTSCIILFPSNLLYNLIVRRAPIPSQNLSWEAHQWDIYKRPTIGPSRKLLALQNYSSALRVDGILFVLFRRILFRGSPESLIMFSISRALAFRSKNL